MLCLHVCVRVRMWTVVSPGGACVSVSVCRPRIRRARYVSAVNIVWGVGVWGLRWKVWNVRCEV